MASNFDASQESQGLGDTIAKITHAVGLDTVAQTVAQALGQEDCGCNKRREKLNSLFPYKQNTPSPIRTPSTDTGKYRILSQITIVSAGQNYVYFKDQIVEVDQTHPLSPYVDTFVSNKTLEPVIE